MQIPGDKMQQPHDKYDKVMQDYAKKWMKSLDKPRYSTSMGTFFVLIFLFIWASTLTNQLGYVPMQGSGIVVFLALIIALGLGCYFINSLLTQIGFPKSIRSAIWFSALIGPYLGIVAINNLQNPVLSHLIGVTSSIISFILSFGLDKLFVRRSRSTIETEA